MDIVTYPIYKKKNFELLHQNRNIMAITLLPIRLYFHNQASDKRPNYSQDTIMAGVPRQQSHK